MASILLLKPKYAILDEPDSGIDIMSLDMINNIMNKVKSWGGTPIVITHREEIAKNSDYIYLICNGLILKQGNPKEMITYFKKSCDNCNHANILTDVKAGETI
jgi:Fe-S cluster assembly ATP-binding protein